MGIALPEIPRIGWELILEGPRHSVRREKASLVPPTNGKGQAATIPVVKALWTHGCKQWGRGSLGLLILRAEHKGICRFCGLN